MKASQFVSLTVACFALSACGKGGSGSGSGTGTESDTQPTAPATSETSPTSETVGTTTGPTSTASTSGGSESETNGTDTEGDCEIELPRPGECMAYVGDPWSEAKILDIDYHARLPKQDGPSALVDDGELYGDTGGFIEPPDLGGPVECDLFLQDCADGEKCMPWADDGGSAWNATKCSPVDPNPKQVGEPCTAEGNGVSGVDDCEKGAMCWDVDPETNMGECIELCGCSPNNPICETEGTICIISNQGVLPLCQDVCNPLDQTCAAGQACYPAEDAFVCAPDASGGASQGDACSFINACSPGFACVSAGAVPGCQSASCCTAFCETDEDTCAQGMQCIPWYQGGNAPTCLEQVGICGA